MDATPGDKLIKMLKETESKFRVSDNCRIKFVSKSGVKLVNLLQRTDPFQMNCKSNCKPCEYAEKEGKLSICHREGVCYESKYEDCYKKCKIRVYYGDTARNVHVAINTTQT